MDYWSSRFWSSGIGSVGANINFIATVLTAAGAGLTMRRLPLFAWMIFVNAFLVIVALTGVERGLVMMMIDRLLETHFFLPAPAAPQSCGGISSGPSAIRRSISWRIPSFGMISEMIPVFSRKPIFGYEFVAGSTVAIGLLSLGVSANHMFTTGWVPDRPGLRRASMLIAIPTGVKIFNWTATMSGGPLRLTIRPCSFARGALFNSWSEA